MNDNELTVWCAWCDAWQSGPEPTDPAKVSHTICPACLKACFGELIDAGEVGVLERAG